MSFYISGCDEYGSTNFHAPGSMMNTREQVIEGEIIEDSLRSIRVIAPQEIAEKWPTINLRYLWEVEGPVRELSFEEYKALVKQFGVEIQQ